MRTLKILNPSTDTTIIASIADSFMPKLLGLMFRKKIKPDSCLILSESFDVKLRKK